jgi:general secretion pathway protein A
MKQNDSVRQKKAAWPLCVFSIIGMSCLPCFVSAADNIESDMRDTARLLAILLDSGRVVIGRNQDLINDPSRLENRFTVQLFADQTTALFKQRTGHNLADLSNGNIPMAAKPLLERLLEQGKKTVETFQPVLHMQGLKYKGLIPATFGTKAAARFHKNFRYLP